MYKHFTVANEYFVESQASMEHEPELVQALDAIFTGVTEVQNQIRDRAKLGSTAVRLYQFLFPLLGKSQKDLIF